MASVPESTRTRHRPRRRTSGGKVEKLSEPRRPLQRRRQHLCLLRSLTSMDWSATLLEPPRALCLNWPICLVSAQLFFGRSQYFPNSVCSEENRVIARGRKNLFSSIILMKISGFRTVGLIRQANRSVRSLTRGLKLSKGLIPAITRQTII